MEVRILYSGVGDTDPIRECRDGAILQIIRAYHPEKAVLFLSKDMTAKEEAYQRYTKPIEAVDPSCAIELIKTDIVNVHKIDSLHQMVDEFYRLIDRYPDDEFLINTSSGTPQMKMIMAMLAIEYEKATAIQVDSPQRGSNRNTHALNDDATVEEIIENNLDSDPEEYRNRCSEPKLRFIKYRQVARELEKLTQAYSYKDALELANKNRDIISTEVIALLQHAYKRSNLEIQEAADAIKGKKDLHEFAIPHDTADEVDAQLLSLRGVGLHIAAAGSHHGLGIAALGPADHLPGFFIADGGDGAGVDDVGVRRGLKVHQRVATPLKLLLHGLRLVLVDLAAEGVNSNSHGDSPCTLRFSPI